MNRILTVISFLILTTVLSSNVYISHGAYVTDRDFDLALHNKLFEVDFEQIIRIDSSFTSAQIRAIQDELDAKKIDVDIEYDRDHSGYIAEMAIVSGSGGGCSTTNFVKAHIVIFKNGTHSCAIGI